MGGTVRTSYTVRASAEAIDNPSCERERNRLDELSLVFDEDSPVMRGERGHDVLPFQFPADEVFCAVEFDTAVTVDLADKRDAALGDGKNQVTAGIDVMIETEAGREMAEGSLNARFSSASSPPIVRISSSLTSGCAPHFPPFSLWTTRTPFTVSIFCAPTRIETRNKAARILNLTFGTFRSIFSPVAALCQKNSTNRRVRQIR